MNGIKESLGHAQRGAVSLFIVIFAALLLTVITVGFIQLMIQEQKQSLNNDLSQSAYDSAVAGVEDGKRAIRKCLDGDTGACAQIAIPECDTVSRAGVVGSLSNTETMIVDDSGPAADTSLDQAYTCVKITMDTDDVRVNLRKDQSMMIPLKALASFDKIRVRWMHKNVGGSDTYFGGDVATLQGPLSSGVIDSLPVESAWSPNAPSLLRVQTILPDKPSAADTVTQEDLDGSMASNVFLRPANTLIPGQFAAGDPGTTVAVSTDRAANFNIVRGPAVVACSSGEYNAGGDGVGYACLATLDPAHSVPPQSGIAYLRLTSLYRDTSVRIELLDGSNPVKFYGVQPEIDSTGRANNVFRRVVSRVSPSMSQMAYPEYGIDVTGSLCKDYYITDDASKANAIVASPPCNSRP